jgi:hypothetical protein
MLAPDCQAKNAHSESRSPSLPEFQSWLKYRRGGLGPLVDGDRDQREQATSPPSLRRREGDSSRRSLAKKKRFYETAHSSFQARVLRERSALCGSKPSSRSRALSHAAAGSSVPAVATVPSNRSDHRITVSCRRSASVDAKTRRCFGRRWTPPQSGRRVEPPHHLAKEGDAKIPEIIGVGRSSTRPQSPFDGMLAHIATAQGCGVGPRSPSAVASIIPR